MHTPERLRKGDCIGIVSPSSPEKHVGRVERGVRYLEKCGYRVVVGKHVESRNGYLAGSDGDRAADMNAMFADKRVKAILCTRGGYGTARILPLLDWNGIRRNPKIFVGFSDGTALNLALLAKAKLISFTGALPGVDFWKETPDAFTEKNFWRALTSPTRLAPIKIERVVATNPSSKRIAKSRAAEGVLIGGNLVIVASLIGTPYLPSIQSPIWALEDVTEEPYRIDRLLTQLQLSGQFARARSVVFGEFAHCEPEDRSSQTVPDVIVDLASRISPPVFQNLQYGHVARKLTLPLGVRVRISTRNGELRFLEASVK